MQYQTTLLEPIRLRLVAELPNGIEVIHLPQSPAEANNNQSFAKRVIIAFGSTEYVDRLGVSDKSFMSNNSFVTQNGFVLVYLLVESRLLRGNDGIFQLISEVKRALVGHDVPSYGRLHLGKIIPNPDAPDGINSYFIEVYCKERLVADLPDETGQLITAINGVTAPETTPSDGLLVANSDASYNVTITENKILPDIAVIDFAGTTHVWPSVKNVNFAAGDLPDFDTGSGGDPVTVDVNGTEVEADPGETVTVNVTRGGAPIGDVTVTGSTIDVVVPVCAPCEDATVTLNSDEVATVEAGGELALTTTLDNVPVAATYTAGVININNPAPSGYRGIPLGSPSQLYKIRNGDTGRAFELDAFTDSNPSGFIGFNQLDGTDISGTTLLYNNSLGNKFRFTDLGGSGNSFTLVDWIGGDGITYQAKVMIDHLYGPRGTMILLTENTGRWSTTWQSRVDGATYDGSPIFSASRGILEQLIRLDTASNHLVSIMGHIGVVTSGEAVTTATSGGSIQIYNLNANLIGVSNIATPDTKTLLFTQL